MRPLSPSELLRGAAPELARGEPPWLPVVSSSMWPTLRPGDQVRVEPRAAELLRVGDLVVFELEDGRKVVHRLLAVDRRQGTLLTKGDILAEADAPLKAERVLGVAVARKRGKRVSALRTPARLLAGRLVALGSPRLLPLALRTYRRLRSWL